MPRVGGKQAEICGIKASEKPLWKAFKFEEQYRRITRKNVFFETGTNAKQLQFTLHHSYWTKEDWQYVICTNMCYVWLHVVRGNILLIQRVGKDYSEDCITSMCKKQHSFTI